jgi:hypothetical protein
LEIIIASLPSYFLCTFLKGIVPEDPFLELSVFILFYRLNPAIIGLYWDVLFPNGKYCSTSLDVQPKVFKFILSVLGDIRTCSVGFCRKREPCP